MGATREILAEGSGGVRGEEAGAAGATAAKVCGAGGGGCLFCYGPPRQRGAIRQALAAGGARLLDYHFERDGLTRG